MKVTYNLYYQSKQAFKDIEVDEIESCPHCHVAGHPHFEGGYIVSNHEETTGVHLFIILYCTVCTPPHTANRLPLARPDIHLAENL